MKRTKKEPLYPTARVDVPEIIASFSDRSAKVRWQALLDSDDGPRKVSLLMARIGVSDPHPRVRNLAAELLGEIGTRLDAHRVQQLLNDSSWIVRSSAVEALRQVLGKRALPLLIRMLDDCHYIVRRDAARHLGELGIVDAVPLLHERQETETNDQALMGLRWGLVALGERELIPAMLELLKSEFLGIRFVGAYYLNKLLDLGPLTDSELAAIRAALAAMRDLDDDRELNESINKLEVRLNNIIGPGSSWQT